MSSRRIVLAAVTTAALAGCGRAHGPDRYAWHGEVAPGGWLRIHNANGAVRVARASGAEAVVTAVRTYRGRRPEPVRMVTERRGADVIACVAWGDAERCDERGPRRARGLLARLLRGDGATDLAFVVAVPAGVRVEATTVNGRVTIADAPGEVIAKSVNGSVVVGAVEGPVRASSVNGSVTARVAALAPGAAVSLSTRNGSVTALLPATLDASVRASTTNGRIATDFPGVTVARGARSLETVLGAGSHEVSLRTVNGGVRVQRLP